MIKFERQPLKIALFGYGKMGKMIEKAATDRGHEIIAVMDPQESRTPQALVKADLCIDFSHPNAALENIEKAAKNNKNIVVGTSGWYGQLKLAKETIAIHSTALLYSSNFSLGFYRFLQILEKAAEGMNHHPEYDVGIIEQHHRHKVDSPSGTAQMMAKTLLTHIKRKNRAQYERLDQQIGPEEIHVVSFRCGVAPGTHSAIFESAADTITLTHQAHNREGFALGAVIGAEWLKDKKGTFTLEDMMESLC